MVLGPVAIWPSCGDLTVNYVVWLSTLVSDVKNGALWFSLLWLGLIGAGLIYTFFLEICLITEIRREQKQNERKPGQYAGKPDKLRLKRQILLGLFRGIYRQLGEKLS